MIVAEASGGCGYDVSGTKGLASATRDPQRFRPKLFAILGSLPRPQNAFGPLTCSCFAQTYEELKQRRHDLYTLHVQQAVKKRSQQTEAKEAKASDSHPCRARPSKIIA